MNWVDLLDPKAFHDLFFRFYQEIINFIHDWFGFLSQPRRFFNSIEKQRNHSFPSVFLVINLILGVLVRNASLNYQFYSARIKDAIPTSYHYAIGSGIFLLLLHFLGRRLSYKKLFAVFCYSSVAYIPFAAAHGLFTAVAGDVFLNFWATAVSGKIRDIHSFLQPFLPLTKLGSPILLLLVCILCWWMWLLLIGLESMYPAMPRWKLNLRIWISALGYIFFKTLVCVLLSVVAIYSLVTMGMKWSELKKIIKNDPVDYGRVLILSQELAVCKYLPIFVQYNSTVIASLAQTQIFNPLDMDVKGPLESIRNNSYRKAQLAFQEMITNKLADLKSPKRYIFQMSKGQLQKAEELHSSPYYSEALNQTGGFQFSFDDIPIKLLP